MNNKINIAVIGAGNMGRHHARNYYELETAELIAIADADESKKELAEKFGCKFYKDYKEMLEKEKIDAVSIAVPTKFHKQVAFDVIKKGKHILLEKPIADNIQDAEEIIKEAKAYKIKLMIGHIERFNPAVQKLKELIDVGKLGQISSIIARRVGLFIPQIQNVNVILDLAVHDIDVINYLVGMEPKIVHKNSGEALSSLNGVDDYAELFLKYDQGISGFIQVNWITPIKIRNLSVTGTKGYAELNYITQELVVHESNYNPAYQDFKDFVVKFGTPNEIKLNIKIEEPLKLELKHFIDCILENKEPLVSGEDGLSALRVALGD